MHTKEKEKQGLDTNERKDTDIPKGMQTLTRSIRFKVYINILERHVTGHDISQITLISNKKETSMSNGEIMCEPFRANAVEPQFKIRFFMTMVQTDDMWSLLI